MCRPCECVVLTQSGRCEKTTNEQRRTEFLKVNSAFMNIDTTHSQTLRITATHCNTLSIHGYRFSKFDYWAEFEEVSMCGRSRITADFSKSWLMNADTIHCQTLQTAATHCNTPSIHEYRYSKYDYWAAITEGFTCGRSRANAGLLKKWLRDAAKHRNSLQHTQYLWRLIQQIWLLSSLWRGYHPR